jgi:hypothetical protein
VSSRVDLGLGSRLFLPCCSWLYFSAACRPLRRASLRLDIFRLFNQPVRFTVFSRYSNRLWRHALDLAMAIRPDDR